MTQMVCSACGGNLSRCRIPGGVAWAWRCGKHGLVHDVAPKGSPKAIPVPEGIAVPNREQRRAAKRARAAQAEAPKEPNVQHGDKRKPAKQGVNLADEGAPPDYIERKAAE